MKYCSYSKLNFLPIIFILLSFCFSINSAQANWSTPVRIAAPGGFEYPQILALGDTLHVVFMHLVRGRGIGYVRSTDAGLTWSEEVELTDTINTAGPLFPQLMSWRQNLLATWRAQFHDGVNLQNIGYSISHNNGISWSAPRYIFSSNHDFINSISAANNDSVVNVIFIAPGIIFYNSRSNNFGQTWAEPDSIIRVDYSSKADQAAAGDLVHFTWPGPLHAGDEWETYYFRSTDKGITWSSNIPISDTDSHVSDLPTVAINEQGNPSISWLDSKYSPPGIPMDVFMRNSNNMGANWEPENQVTTNHKALDSDICWANDTLHLVWADARFGANSIICYSFSSDSGTTWNLEEILVGDTVGSGYPTIAASNGKAYVIWCDDHSNPDTSLDGGLYFTRNPAFLDVIAEPGIPDKTNILKSYPNPFNSSTIISYSNLEEESEVAIYNSLGQKIKTFKIENGGEGKIIWDAKDAKGNKVSSGIYFIKAGAFQQTYSLKLIYLK